MYNNITNNPNFTTHQLQPIQCGPNPNQLNYAHLFNNNHIPFYPQRRQQSYILPPPPPQPPVPQQPSTTQQQYGTPTTSAYTPYNLSYSAVSIPRPPPTTKYCTDYYIGNRQIPINMNVSYKKSSINIHNNQIHHHHNNLIHDQKQQQQQRHQRQPLQQQPPHPVNHVHYHFQSLPSIPPIPPLPMLPIPPIPPIPPLSVPDINTSNHHKLTPYLASATPHVPRSSSITSQTSIDGNINMLTELMKDSQNTLISKLTASDMLFFINKKSNHSHHSNPTHSHSHNHNHSKPKRVSFPTGDKEKDKYIGLKRIGAGTFADIWEVYDQYDPKRKHWAIKVLKKSKCINKESKCVDNDKYIKYTNAMIAEGNRILRLNKQSNACGNTSSGIIECKEILKCMNSNRNSIHQHSYPNNIGPCVVLELMGISLLQYTQLYEKNKVVVPLVTVRCIAIQLFASLSFLHGVGGYIHADLKPENVLITLQHSINGNLMNNRYPHIKIVDLGNALSYNRNINTFEVQSLYYRAPEVLFGNEMTSSIDLWSIGCILFELININEFNSSLYFGQGNDPDKKRRHHHALFACCNRVGLSHKINDILSPYPYYVYNKYNSFYYTDLNLNLNININITHSVNAHYQNLKEFRKKQLVKRLSNNNNLSLEYLDFIDLIACLLDLNPSTRYSSEDAIQHPFCIDLKYIHRHQHTRNTLSTSTLPTFDPNILNLLTNNYHSSYPMVSITDDYHRQYRINQQIQQYNLYKNQPIHIVPKEMAITKKNNFPSLSHTRSRTVNHNINSNTNVKHNKIVCLLNGCCNNPTITSIKKEYSIIPPLKKMKYTNQHQRTQ